MVTLTSENLTGLGGPMGSERTTTNWRKYFSTPELAMEYAEKDFGEKIPWRTEGVNFHSPDLRYVMYHINHVEVEA
jgi:hypothetical protein